MNLAIILSSILPYTLSIATMKLLLFIWSNNCIVYRYSLSMLVIDRFLMSSYVLLLILQNSLIVGKWCWKNKSPNPYVFKCINKKIGVCLWIQHVEGGKLAIWSCSSTKLHINIKLTKLQIMLEKLYVVIMLLRS